MRQILAFSIGGCRRAGAAIAWALVLVLSPAAMTEALGAEPASRQALDFFEQKVRPVLAMHCVECHGPQRSESDLRLDSREAMLRGGDSGAAVVPGRPDESLLISAVRRESFEMPPEEMLDDSQIAALEQWVRMGAPWTVGDGPSGPALGDQEHLSRKGAEHWAFQPVRKPAIPQVNESARVATGVDAFILSKLEARGMRPSPAADRRTLLRRVTFDLTGLPPAHEEIEAFERDRSDGAWRKVVDRLLDSPHYGERWGRHWLDVARYADTRDWQAQTDPRYPFAYTYRDWVIAAFNRDMRYDDFIRYQIAAERYTDQADSPELAALGFLTVGPRYRNNALEQAADRIDVVTRGLMGLTVICARCHDHKYDPIPIGDYYSLYGVFASCDIPDELPIIASGVPPKELLADYERQRAEKVAEFEAWKQGLVDEATAELRLRIADYLVGYYEMNVTRQDSIRGLVSKYKLKETAMTPLAANLDRLKTNRRWNNHPVLRAWAALVGVPDAKMPAAVRGLLGDEAQPMRGVPPMNARVAAMLQDDPPQNGRELVAAYGRLLGEAEQAWQQTTRQVEGRAVTALGDAALEQVRQVLHAADGPFALEVNAVVQASRLFATARAAIGKFQTAIQEVDMTHPGAPARAMVLADRPRPVDPVVFLRGEPQRRGDAVPRRFLSVIAGRDAPPFEQGSGRRELAEAIVSPDNPLARRVMVDRVWRHHFGRGLVAVAGDFGLRTPQPLQQDLLDWLSATFMEQGWSVKNLHRLILLSSTYRQASDDVPEFARNDPENDLYWRQNRRRLDFEAMRDAMLAVSGQLDTTIGGRPVPLSDEPLTTRRTVYGYVDRVNLDPVFATFDFASPDATVAERPETMVPQQALFGMNNAFVVEQARKLAGSPALEAIADPAGRVQFLYRRLFGRRATAREVNLTVRFVEAADAASPQPLLTWQYGYGSADPRATAEDRFRPLPFFTGREYQGGAELPDRVLGHCKLSASGGAPGRSQEQAVVRRWVAPRAMTIEIRGTLSHLRDKGDGIRAQIVAGRGGRLGQWTVFNDTVETAVERYEVRQGETIDMVVDCRSNANSDAFSWAPVIRPLDAGDGAVAAVWDARKDFKAPPAAPMNGWAQAVQALMLTNEFMFLD